MSFDQTKADPLIEADTVTDAEPTGERPMKPSVVRGWNRKCPKCGSGPMFQGYLKVRDECQVCNEQLHHHRADDGPAYLTILIVGHIMAPFMHILFVSYRPEPLVMFSILAVGCVGLSLYLLPRLKGVVVSIQWSKRMHGF